MSFTAPTISHTFLNADSTAASGTISFALLGRMTNSGTSIVPASFTVNLDSTGHFSQTVTSNMDPTTIPNDPPVAWRVDIRIQGASQENYVVQIPPIQTETNATTKDTSKVVQLSSLNAQPWMVGQSVSGSGIPTGAFITAVNNAIATLAEQQTGVGANQITLSSPATITATGVSLTIGESIDLGYVMGGNQQID